MTKFTRSNKYIFSHSSQISLITRDRDINRPRVIKKGEGGTPGWLR